MLTKNGRKILGSLFANYASGCESYNTNVYYKDLEIVTSSGELLIDGAPGNYSVSQYSIGYFTTKKCDINELYDISTSSSYIYYRLGVCVGTGNSPETIDDYTLESCGLTGKSCSIIRAQDSCVLQCSTVVYNGTDEAVTVREIGLGVWIDYASDQANFLIYRKVLDAPIVIEPDQSYTFTLALR